MIQEYFLQEPAEKDAVKAYKPEGISKRLFSADNGNCWYVQFSEDGDNEGIAKRLSDVDEYVRAHFHVTLLDDGCSAYFNGRLYPLVSGFEYKLRKLLYLTSAINHDEKSASNIADLESQDFGQIFTLLFIDTAFMGKVKEEVKTRNREVFSKADVIAAIESIDENTLWDALLGKDSVPTLRRRFNDVREYRNDVMHSHHLNWKRFREILSLYKAINSELNKALHDIEVVESKAPSKPTFNQTLDGALRAQEQLSTLAEALRPSLEEMHRLSELYTQNPALLESMKRMSEITAGYTVSPELQKTLEQFSQLSKAYTSSPAFLELQEQFRNMAKLKVDIPPAIQELHEIAQNLSVPKIEIPPELLRLQKSLDSIHLEDEPKGTDENEEQTDNSDNDNVDGGND